MKLTIIKWRDIPTQVMIKKSRREVEKVQLNNRFMVAVDAAATVDGSTDSDAYLADWNNQVINIPDGDLREPVQNMASEIDKLFTTEILQEYVKNAGFKPK